MASRTSDTTHAAPDDATLSLRAARGMVGLTLQELANAAGEPVSTVHALEQGTVDRPSYRLCMRVTRALRLAGLKNLRSEQLFGAFIDNN